jgi:hypothetical protein
MIAKHEQVLRASMQLVPIANGLLKQEIGEPLHKVLRASLTLGQSTASLTARARRRPSLSRPVRMHLANDSLPAADPTPARVYVRWRLPAWGGTSCDMSMTAGSRCG